MTTPHSTWQSSSANSDRDSKTRSLPEVAPTEPSPRKGKSLRLLSPITNLVFDVSFPDSERQAEILRDSEIRAILPCGIRRADADNRMWLKGGLPDIPVRRSTSYSP